MPAQYAPLPNPRIDPDAEDEMNAAFADSDNESDGDDANEAQPLRRPRRRSQASSRRSSSIDRGGDDHDHDDGPLAGTSTSRFPMPAAATSAIPPASSSSTSGGYDFDNVDYAAHAPPGSPPPATLAFANDWGNSNGILPGPSSGPSSSSSSSRGPTPQRRAGWLGRAVGGVLPEGVARRLGIGAGSQRPRGAVGGGTQNDGVFANVMAKPVRPVRVQDGDGTYVVPEDAQREQPPSYAAAQADPAPTYWEATTVHVPGGAAIAGEVIVDGLATGSLFSFLWNGLISVSFQFIGFLLTYLLHTTHAARLGSRAGLGITLIQYGFALRRSDYWNEDDAASGGGGTSSGYIYPPPTTSEGTPEAQADYYRTHNTSAPVPASDTLPEGSVNYLVSESTTEWLAFFLMTVGWFILLTSLLGYWRVKRWERSILASTPAESTNNASASSADTPQMPVFGFFNVPGFPGALRGGNHGGGGPFTPSILRQGLGFARSGGRRGRSGRRDGREEDLYFHTLDLELGPDEDEEARARAAQAEPRPGHTQFVINESDPERAQQLARALVAETRLNVDLRAAGLI